MMTNNNEIIKNFQEDCQELVQTFINMKNPDFRCFCMAWKKMNFHYIFFGYASDHELLQFLEDAMITVKHMLLDSKEIVNKLGCLYLMYALYFKQPTKEYSKFRFTVEEWKIMNNIYHEFGAYNQARLIFWKLLVADAIRFVEAEYEFGFERFMHKDFEMEKSIQRVHERFSNNLETNLTEWKDKTDGIIPALEILQVGYNEMKEHLDKEGPSHGVLPSSDIIGEISKGIKNIEEYFKLSLKRKNDYDDSDEDQTSESDDIDIDIGTRRKNLKKQKSIVVKEVAMESEYRCRLDEDDNFINIYRPNKTFLRDAEKEKSSRTVIKSLEGEVMEEIES